MFKYIENIRNNFKNYQLNNDQLLGVYLDESGNTVIQIYGADDHSLINEINLECKTFNIFFYSEDELIAYFPMQRLVRVNLLTGEIQISEGIKLAPERFLGNSLLGISVNKASKKILGRLDLATNQISPLIEEPFRLWESSDNSLYGVKIGEGHEIYSIDPVNGFINWQYDFGIDLSGKILLCDRIVIVLSQNIIFGLDLNTGKLVWKNEFVNSLTKLYEGNLINITNSYYREISSISGEILLEYAMNDEYITHGFTSMGINSNFTVTDTHVFIVDAMGFKMGCINRSTGKIDWSVEVGKSKITLPHAPIVYQDKLYVLDDEGTLHIYEKEELAT